MSKTRKWYTKGLYLVFALALLVGLSVTPASADVSKPTVTVSPNTAGLSGQHTINFDVGSAGALVAGSGDIFITFNSAYVTAGTPSGWVDGDVTVNGALVLAGKVTLTTWSGVTAIIKITDIPVDIPASSSVEVIFKTSFGMKNPTAGSYDLDVKTDIETAEITSKSYLIAGLPGLPVSLYTDTGEFVNSYYKIQGAIGGVTAGKTGWRIEVSSDYNSATGAEAFPITVDESVTLKSIDGAASTTIDATAGAKNIFWVKAANVIIGGSDCGFTMKSKGSCVVLEVAQGCTNPTVQGNIMLAGAHGIIGGMALLKATIRDNTITWTTLSAHAGIWLNALGGTVIDNNEVTKHAIGIALWSGTGQDSTWANPITVSNNRVHGNGPYDGISIADNSVGDLDYVAVSGNDCYDNVGSGIIMGGAGIGDINVAGNNLYNNQGSGLYVSTVLGATDAATIYVFGNNIYGNTATVGASTGNDYGIWNSATTAVPATHNWWGDATGPSGVGSGSGDAVSGSVTYSPWLEASVSAAKFAAGATSLDAATAVGVKVSGVTANTANKIGAALYTENPKTTPTFTVVEDSYTDVYVAPGVAIVATDEIILKFSPAGVDENSVVHAWNETYGTWEECTDQDYSPYAGGYVWVKVHSELNTTDPTTPTIEALAGLPFVVSTEAVGPDEPADYDEDGSGYIEIDELLNAISDYIGGVPGADISLLLDVISAYINETAV